MPVLQYLDVGIGYVLAILLAATLVGAAMQAFQSLARVRQRQLREGLATLVASLHPDLAEEAAVLAEQLTGEARVKGGNSSAEVIAREEFILLLIRKAADQGTEGKLSKAIVEMTGLEPKVLLGRIQELLLQKEIEDPRAPAYLWRVRAIAEAGCGRLAGRIFAWYDHTMDRVEDRVNFNGRLISAVLAFVVCFFLNLDSIDLVRRLSRDENFRKALVERAVEEARKSPPGEQTTPDPAVKKFLGLADDSRQLLVIDRAWETDQPLRKFFGILISWAMVSLGAPFWFGILNKALGLRSTLAQRVEQQREHREADNGAAT